MNFTSGMTNKPPNKISYLHECRHADDLDIKDPIDRGAHVVIIIVTDRTRYCKIKQFTYLSTIIFSGYFLAQSNCKKFLNLNPIDYNSLIRICKQKNGSYSNKM